MDGEDGIIAWPTSRKACFADREPQRESSDNITRPVRKVQRFTAVSREYFHPGNDNGEFGDISNEVRNLPL